MSYLPGHIAGDRRIHKKLIKMMNYSGVDGASGVGTRDPHVYPVYIYFMFYIIFSCFWCWGAGWVGWSGLCNYQTSGFSGIVLENHVLLLPTHDNHNKRGPLVSYPPLLLYLLYISSWYLPITVICIIFVVMFLCSWFVSLTEIMNKMLSEGQNLI